MTASACATLDIGLNLAVVLIVWAFVVGAFGRRWALQRIARPKA